VTPFELEVALKPEQSWTGRYVLDLQTLLSGQADKEDAGMCFSSAAARI
jgi:diphthamide biosynthesis protein 2